MTAVVLFHDGLAGVVGLSEVPDVPTQQANDAAAAVGVDTGSLNDVTGSLNDATANAGDLLDNVGTDELTAVFGDGGGSPAMDLMAESNANSMAQATEMANKVGLGSLLSNPQEAGAKAGAVGAQLKKLADEFMGLFKILIGFAQVVWTMVSHPWHAGIDC